MRKLWGSGNRLLLIAVLCIWWCDDSGSEKLCSSESQKILTPLNKKFPGTPLELRGDACMKLHFLNPCIYAMCRWNCIICFDSLWVWFDFTDNACRCGNEWRDLCRNTGDDLANKACVFCLLTPIWSYFEFKVVLKFPSIFGSCELLRYCIWGLQACLLEKSVVNVLLVMYIQ